MSYKTDYDWTDLTDEPVNDCYLCETKLTSIGNSGIYGHNPEPVVKGVDNRVCSDCNFTIVIPKRIEEDLDEQEKNRRLN